MYIAYMCAGMLTCVHCAGMFACIYMCVKHTNICICIWLLYKCDLCNHALYVICMCMHENLYVSIYVCVYMFVCKYICVTREMYTRTCEAQCVFLSVGLKPTPRKVYVCKYMYLRTCMCVRMQRMCVHNYIQAYLYISLYLMQRQFIASFTAVLTLVT